MRRLLLNGDIGGTNARLQMWQLDDTEKHVTGLVCDKRYPSGQFTGLNELLSAFLADSFSLTFFFRRCVNIRYAWGFGIGGL